ncbi:MAG: hypothetical protein ABIK18_00265 [candidate division WOR-3 bacterium]
MAAGLAVDDWRHWFEVNPAVCISQWRFGADAVYTRPYGLTGLNCGKLGVNLRQRNVALGVGIHIVGIEGAEELKTKIGLGLEPVSSVKVGIGIGALIQDMRYYGVDWAPVFDIGVLYQKDKLSFGLSGKQLNSPRLKNGDEVPYHLGVGVAWEPISSLLLTLDLYREGRDEGGAAGVEIRFFPELAIRAGVGTMPFHWCAGVGIRLGCFHLDNHQAQFGLDYSYQLHPELGDTHIFSINWGWN